MKINKRILNNISLFEENINYEFTNKEYILEALTHSSYSNENKNYAFNERLEFLGDSVLSIVISDYLFKKETKLPEGELTKIRANIVCEESLSEVSKDIHLGKYMLLGKGEEATGGRERISILADALEAVIAAIYLDGGLEYADKFIIENLKEEINEATKHVGNKDYKTVLQEKLQIHGDVKIEYEIIKEVGPDHDKTFEAQVKCDGKILAQGEGKSKKEAQMHAAKKALENIK